MSDKEKLAQWMIERGYTTGHGDTIENLLQELHWQINENWDCAYDSGAEKEREACARIVEADADARGKGGGGLVLLKAAERIRARGQK